MSEATRQVLEVLIFEVGGQLYALPSSSVRQVVRAVTVVPLPRAPAIVEGVVNVRGTLVPVLDIRSRFRLPPKPLEHTDHLVLGWAGSRPVAVRVDRALELVRLDASQIEDARRAAPGVEYVAGVAKLDDGLVLIHDLQTFLWADEAVAIDEAIEEASSRATDGDAE